MALQNRVTPFGEIVADPGRGLFTGNRGIIHDPVTRTLLKRRWTTKSWIVCTLDFRGRTRPVMSPGTWTELFFLDELTAFAAGHRPCFYCRRTHARAFAQAFAMGNGLDAPRAPAIDAVLHRQRPASSGFVSHRGVDDLASYPDGIMLASAQSAYALRNGKLLPWSMQGYGAPQAIAALGSTPLRLLTPPSICRALAAGYSPLWHHSAD